jgi:hypothetical protein
MGVDPVTNKLYQLLDINLVQPEIPLNTFV